MAEYNGGWSRGYVYGASGELIANQQENTVHWTHADPVTKEQQWKDTQGTWMGRIVTDPWGGEALTGLQGQTFTYNSFRQPRKFTTYHRDSNGGDEAQHRRYQAAWSRFDQPDPYDGSMSLTDPQSFNRYSYVQNDPVNLVDPSGLFELPANQWYMEVRGSYDPWLDDDGNRRFLMESLSGGARTIEPMQPIGEVVTPNEPPVAPNTEPQRRQPCPPSKQEISESAAVQQGLEEALQRYEKLKRDTGKSVEHGGWILWNRRTGRISVRHKTPVLGPPLGNQPAADGYFGVYLNNPPRTPRGSAIVGTFHIHVENLGATDFDDAATDQYGVPGILATPDRKWYTHGNYNRGIWGQGTPPGC